MLVLLAAEPASAQPGSPLSPLLLFGVMGVVFYFFMIRPRKLQARQHQALISSIEVGDEVETVAGMFGTVRRLSDEGLVWVELAPGTTVKMARGAIRRKVVRDTDG